MHGEKTVSVGFRVTPEFKRLLGIAARLDHRSMTNLLEKLLSRPCKTRNPLFLNEVLDISYGHILRVSI
jgi:hypothetical protein